MRRGLEREDDHSVGVETKMSGESSFDEKKEEGSATSDTGGARRDQGSDEGEAVRRGTPTGGEFVAGNSDRGAVAV